MVYYVIVKIYFFGSTVDMVDELCESGFDGSLFLFNIRALDQFVRVARHIDKEKNFKYMIAFRPYVMSPQYLCMITNSMNLIASDRVEINMISGHTYNGEENIGGIIGDVDDNSSNIDKSKYMIKFLDSLSKMSKDLTIPPIYVSTTNNYTFDATMKYGHKAIVPYSKYINKDFALDNKNTIISIGPLFKNNDLELGKKYPDDTVFFTKEKFAQLLDDFKNDGFYGVLIYGLDEHGMKDVISFVKEYKSFKFGGK